MRLFGKIRFLQGGKVMVYYGGPDPRPGTEHREPIYYGEHGESNCVREIRIYRYTHSYWWEDRDTGIRYRCHKYRLEKTITP